jgi:ribosomal protein S18 acetylase RimI-like enzyme
MLAASRSHLARGWYDIALAASEGRCLEFLAALATAEEPSWWHYSHFLIAEVDGQSAAALAAFRAGDAYSLSGAAVAEAAASLDVSDAEQAAIWQRGSYLFLCALGEDDAWTLENIYTAPHHRGRGLAGRLIEHAVREGRERGFDTAQISSFIGNEAAGRAYRKAGFELGGEKRDPEFAATAGAPGMQRWVRHL